VTIPETFLAGADQVTECREQWFVVRVDRKTMAAEGHPLARDPAAAFDAWRPMRAEAHELY
jgi:hypothetical protein